MIHVEYRSDNRIHTAWNKKKKRSNYELLYPVEIIERIVNEDATNCLVSVCSRLARFGRLGRTWDKTRVFGSGSIDKPSGSTLSGLTLRHLNSSVLTAIRDNRHLWKGAGVASREGIVKNDPPLLQTPTDTVFRVPRIVIREFIATAAQNSGKRRW